ncbi:MAG: outer membrane protein assembly factor BamB [Planctomycetota bacterium]|jgi:outer membrane protein assembly factor BamB
MKRTAFPLLPAALVACLGACAHDRSSHLDSFAAEVAADDTAAQTGWLSWRGPDQMGNSPEVGLLDSIEVDGENHLWSHELSGRGTPVIANGRVFGQGYRGDAPSREEVLYCLDEANGHVLWEHTTTDFLSDVIYSRYGIGSPTIDPETGNLFSMTASGLLMSFTPDGEQLWEFSMGERLGRLTFPNGRTGSPMIFEDLVIVHFIFAAWGPMGPARDRFFAFDKTSGEVVWGSTPGGPPKDSSFSMPIVEERGGRSVLYAGLGGGNVVCVDARTGDPIWRFPLSIGGLNCSIVIHGDRAIAIHGKENRDTSAIGRMIALDLNAAPGEDGVLPDSAEIWRNDSVAFTSSPILVGDLIYQTTLTGELVCVDVKDGKILWHLKLGSDQLHASPAAADGKLFVPMNNGMFYIVRGTREGGEILSEVQLEGACLGAPAIANGRVYVHTTTRLYCFGTDGGAAPAWPVVAQAAVGAATRLQLVPADVTIRAGEGIDFEVRRLDASGRVVDVIPSDEVTFEMPPVASTGATGVGVVKASYGDLKGSARVRAVSSVPFDLDFSGGELTMGGDKPFAFPPGEWNGSRPKWKIVDLEGERVLARRIDNPLFQRTMSFIGHPDESNYTIQADVRSEGNRRSMCNVGVVNQRYLIMLKGNHQMIEVSSNMERLKVEAPFKWKVGQWYTMKSRVDVLEDGTGMVRAKVWLRGDPEPEAWTIEVPDPLVNTHGSPGLYGFTLQSRFTTYIDNVSVTSNE